MSDLYMGTFINLCQMDCLDQIKKLYNINININSDTINKGFQNACMFGRIDIAKWLYSIENKPDIYYDNCSAFTNASFYGNLDILKWLYTIAPPINPDDVFKYACRGKNENVLKWLISIYDEYDYEITTIGIIGHGFNNYEKNLIKKIRNMEKQINELQDYNKRNIKTEILSIYI